MQLKIYAVKDIITLWREMSNLCGLRPEVERADHREGQDKLLTPLHLLEQFGPVFGRL